jgi:hypothetical protein
MAGLGLAVALLKPSFGLPLLVALLARGAGSAVGWGLGITVFLNLHVLMVLVQREGGIAPLLTTISESYGVFAASPDNDPLQSVWRVDLASTISRLVGRSLEGYAAPLVAAAVLIPVIWTSRLPARSALDPEREEVLNSLVCCAILLSVYHQAYDLLLLALPAAALVRGIQRNGGIQAHAIAQTLLFTLLAVNYVATHSALDAIQLGSTARMLVLSLNGVAILGLFALYFAKAQSLRRSRQL